MTLVEGTRLGPYRVGTLVGAGGMGEVYRARDERLGRDVAVKVIAAAAHADADLLRRFELEARAVGALNHPGILTVFDVGRHEGGPYVVCELLEGRTLREVLKEGALPVRRATDVGVQVANALAAAHEKGIVHRDLKPENLFVTKDGRVKVLDFGLAKLTPRASPGEDATGSLHTEEVGTRPGTVMGSVGYMAPEQVRGQAADHRCDLFALGAVLYEALAGRRAFQGVSAVDTLSAVLKEEPPELPAPLAGTGVERVVRRCLEKAPERRFQSASDLAFALEALSGTTRSAPTVAPVAPPSRRWAWLVLGIAGLALGGALAAPALRSRLRPAEPRLARLTFRRGSVESARFVGDGRSVVYSARWDGEPARVFTTSVENAQSSALAVPPSRVLAVSPRDEVLVLLSDPQRTLAQVPVGGGPPRELLKGVIGADWSADGMDLAAVRNEGPKWRLEYPVGRVLLPGGQGVLGIPRVSPDGRYVAVTRRSTPSTLRAALLVVDRGGDVRQLGEWEDLWDEIGWLSPDEVAVSVTRPGESAAVHAVSLAGRDRVLRQETHSLEVKDALPSDGRLLVASQIIRGEVRCSIRGGAERDLSWLDMSKAVALSRDGSHLLLDEMGAGGRGGSAWLRPTDGSALPVRLADGHPLALSPDDAWVLVHPETGSPELRLVPVGAGEPRVLPSGNLESVPLAQFSLDGKRLFLTGREHGKTVRLYVQDVDGSQPPRPFGPEGSTIGIPSPDGAWIAVSDARAGPPAIIPAAGGEARPLASPANGDYLRGWTADSKRVLVTDLRHSEEIFAIDIATGARTPWKSLGPQDTVGVRGPLTAVLDAGGRSWCSSLHREQSDLYVIAGLR